ncbi:hypothetical protein V493_07835, partial [Pseudogymnoascus sp. VKM F-4281 (FW-2241)]
MGNLCGSESKSPSAFSTPGRTLASAPPQNATSAPPRKVVTGGPPQRLGGSAGAAGDPRRDAAAAAEARAKAAAKPTGKLGQQLNAQKMQRRTDTLQERLIRRQRALRLQHVIIRAAKQEDGKALQAPQIRGGSQLLRQGEVGRYVSVRAHRHEEVLEGHIDAAEKAVGLGMRGDIEPLDPIHRDRTVEHPRRQRHRAHAVRDGVDLARAAHAADVGQRGADVEARVKSCPFVGRLHVHANAVREDPDAVAELGEVLHGVLGDGLETEDLVVYGGAGDHEEVVDG